MTTISAEDLTIAYEQRTIIDKLSFYIPEGKITTIIGANGCGKSSLLKALTRLLPPKQGVVYLNGQNIATLETKEVAKKLALLPQVQEATNGITVYELVSYGRFPHQSYFGNLSPADKKAIHWAMQATNVMAYADQPVDALSGGQRQRVWLAMALAQGTDTIFLDEPTTYLDLNHQLEILELVKSLNKDAGKDYCYGSSRPQSFSPLFGSSDCYETWQDPLYWYYSRCYDFTYHSRHLPNQTGTG